MEEVGSVAEVQVWVTQRAEETAGTAAVGVVWPPSPSLGTFRSGTTFWSLKVVVAIVQLQVATIDFHC